MQDLEDINDDKILEAEHQIMETFLHCLENINILSEKRKCELA